jgi:hypothetical protein
MAKTRSVIFSQRVLTGLSQMGTLSSLSSAFRR